MAKRFFFSRWERKLPNEKASEEALRLAQEAKTNAINLLKEIEPLTPILEKEHAENHFRERFILAITPPAAQGSEK